MGDVGELDWDLGLDTVSRLVTDQFPVLSGRQIVWLGQSRPTSGTPASPDLLLVMTPGSRTGVRGARRQSVTQAGLRPSPDRWRQRRKRLAVGFVVYGLAAGLLIGFGTRWAVVMVGVSSIAAAVFLDRALQRQDLAAPRWSRAALWLAIPSLGLVFALGIFGGDGRPFGAAILFGPVLDRALAVATFLLHSPRATRVVHACERFIGFNDVPEPPEQRPAG